ncbi:MAG: hypothetical protein A3C49_03835 [Candidatus Doudnabacteria bacterium RIFCSPHIGHO2_02_FULL_42_25]|uniref:Type II secretion system protein GspF domain-containing protein n=1 Tax=Candidatus Doudnabacteria bacterium RIFCSPHIGHO2_01_FULL_41_86 TaxID=1817821 RepID=A0A1F5N8P6_9BACT|nr:MAG: hypothetical protein A2717_00880 [Candidatus Doudnabacteria bacterium RIFCSPHIGHO2_01_FULL_41_86]OGE75397.1 MAG: hypothetical protein A3K07_01395 [Candidatus Doudnabacteria bacterium RIFCSPHIGHO2_01_43_10]OGE86577.1 MAG: hypothetical protein A3E28_04175 [Candidatus Doudnabacteria bacterium RIFCSPHIGHO2_12_FULL_42_22]OGE87477.1 MAG: hypothetical protein A3C49_03835 [Candidatus Doudnabacteria bacterium RIFCSPHIGHO2_02_FULL_42_25]OGE92788.1 MAG: hypothetical protein A2895_04680 [Candidatus
MEFLYNARDNEGGFRTGTVEAVDEAKATEIVRAHGLIVIKIAPFTKLDMLERLRLFDSVSVKELVLFTRQLATLIDAKISIVQALRILESQVSSAKLKSTIKDIGSHVEGGESLSSAIARHPQIFSDMFVNLLRAGELSGKMDESLSYLANQMEKDYDLRSKFISAMTYPAFVVAALIVVGFLMMVYVLPPMISVLTESNVELPITTKILVVVTGFFSKYWVLVLAFLVVSIGLLIFYARTAGGRYVIDRFKIHLPIFGNLFEKIYMARFARNLATLIAGGIPIVQALDSVADIIGNVVYRDIVMKAGTQVRNGKSVASALTASPEFPVIVAQMTQIGESTGQLQEILEKLAGFYEKEVDSNLKVLTTLLEPIVMLLLGVAVATIVAGILMPIYNLASAA